MTKSDANQFNLELEKLCSKYGIFIKTYTTRKSKPEDHIYFREYELSAKITEDHKVELLVE